jgi:phage-related protein
MNREFELVFFESARGESQVLHFLRGLDKKTRQEAGAILADLEEMGHGLERPDAAFLRDGIYELRIISLRNQYRLLYFFAGAKIVIANAFVKKRQRIPERRLSGQFAGERIGSGERKSNESQSWKQYKI